MLNSHPDMKVYTELFLPDAEGYPIWPPNDVEFHRTFLKGKPGSAATGGRTYWTVHYLRHVFARSGVSTVGFKYMYNQIPHSLPVLPYAALTKVKVVHLVRRNLLDIVISAKLAEVTSLYHLARDGREQVPWWPTDRVNTCITLNTNDVLSQLNRLSRERAWIRRWLRLSGTPHHELIYEHALTGHHAFHDVLKFLDLPVPPEGLHSGLEKVRTTRQTEVVENLSEIRDALSGTPYEKFADVDPAIAR